MKKLVILLLFAMPFVMNAQELAIKFYLMDGSIKSYPIADIDSLSVSKSDSKYVMHIYYRDTNIAYYPNEIIQSVKIEKDTSRQLYLNVYIFGYPKPYLVFDIDSIVFKIDKWQPLTIGTQVWMLKNLDVDHYRNGGPIPQVTDATEWANFRSGAWCKFWNDFGKGRIYGKLYNWYAVNDSRGLAPIGWHVPSDAEWKTMEMFLGMSQAQADDTGYRGTNEGGKMKETGTTHWDSPNTGATNESWFSALPGGCRTNFAGTFYNNGYNGYWWSATEYDATIAWYRILTYSDANVRRHNGGKGFGFSVRCVKD